MQSLHKFVCVLCILHIISRSLCIGCGYQLSYLARGGMKIKIVSIVYCVGMIAEEPVDSVTTRRTRELAAELTGDREGNPR